MNTEWSASLLWKPIYLRHNQTSYLEPSPRETAWDHISPFFTWKLSLPPPELENLVEDSMKKGLFDIESDPKKGSRRHINRSQSKGEGARQRPASSFPRGLERVVSKYSLPTHLCLHLRPRPTELSIFLSKVIPFEYWNTSALKIRFVPLVLSDSLLLAY